MTTKPNTAQATPRPWRIENFRLAGCNIKSCEAAPRTIAKLQLPFPNLMTVEENEANAELIVRAVNEYEALLAVAAAADREWRIRQGTACALSGQILEALAALAQVREQNGGGK